VAELPLATAATLGYTSPLFMALLLVWFTRERPATALMGTIALGFAGVLLLLKPTLSADQLWAGLVGLASGGVSALTYYNVRELVRAHEPEYRVVFYYAVFACLCALIWMIPSGWHRLTPDSIGLMAGVAVMGTLGQVFLTRAYGQGTTMVTATLSYSGVVFSSVFGVWIWGDLLPWTSWLAIAMIVASGVVAVQMNPSDGGVRVGESRENGRR
jgi:S-adenosylmethionine uptake transporter